MHDYPLCALSAYTRSSALCDIDSTRWPYACPTQPRQMPLNLCSAITVPSILLPHQFLPEESDFLIPCLVQPSFSAIPVYSNNPSAILFFPQKCLGDESCVLRAQVELTFGLKNDRKLVSKIEFHLEINFILAEGKNYYNSLSCHTTAHPSALAFDFLAIS